MTEEGFPKASGSIKLPHAVIVRAPGLLPMLYRPRELAEDLGVPPTTIKGWIKLGAPAQRDRRRHLWVNGSEFADWVETMRLARQNGKKPMGEDEAYCLGCRKPVKLRNPRRSAKGRLVLLSSECPNCGSTINRGSRNDQS